ncbi:putative retrotransposable element Tf2 155 kDa protein type 1-like [Lyophyllum shimeji]|uniref:Retrotransposable element Tf2 155 kDa protein type 1-like n=1 Tax=Lyophyllum shimeji TaxID=47721 RepID=A0A9P3PFZ4_LYOSH|nr:putative retrotransposable element Tf2 155 kDa protein type 1-like [Lyophyllum shimeji]
MDIFMADGGSHFKNHEVKDFCDELGITHITTAAYAPLKCLCAPNHNNAMDEDDVDPTTIPANWPNHFDEAIRQLNDRILPALNTTLRELLFGLRLRPDNPPSLTTQPTTITDVQTNFTLSDNFHMDAHLRALQDAECCKESFDKTSLLTTFNNSNLVQVYDSASDFNHKAINKIALK